MQQHDIGLERAGERQDLIVDRAAIRRSRHIGIERRDAGTRGELGDAEAAAFLGLAQAGHQGTCGRIAPEEEQRTPALIDAIIGKRGFTARIDQAFMDTPFRGLRHNLGHAADFARQAEIEAAVFDDNDARYRYQRHAGA